MSTSVSSSSAYLPPNAEGGNVCVAVRIRPLIEREEQSGSLVCWTNDSNSLQQIDPNSNSPTQKKPANGPHVFDSVFNTKQKTSQIYQQIVGPIVNEAFSGFNGTILCYGQTSSGKTFTLYGDDEEDGIISLAARDIFERISNDSQHSYIIRISLLEIYNEKMSDLLNGNEVVISETNNTVVPKNLTEIQVLNPNDILDNVKKVQSQRKIGETRMNKESSRSHTILRILMEILPLQSENSDGDAVQVTNALLNFVDLAGSEKAGQTGAQGERFRESTYINKSLSVLSKVVMQLTTTPFSSNNDLTLNTTSTNLRESLASAQGTGKKQQQPPRSFISFRDSKLTHILKNSLSGNAFTAIICNVTPAVSSLEETLSTLRFAKTAKTMKTSPKPNHKILNNTESIAKIRELQTDLERKQSEVDNLTKQLHVYKKSSLGCRTPPRTENAVLATGLSDVQRRKTWCPSILMGLGKRVKSMGNLPQIKENENSRNLLEQKPELFMDSDEALRHFRSLEHQKDKESLDDITFIAAAEVANQLKDAQIQTDSFTDRRESSEPPKAKKPKYTENNYDNINATLLSAPPAALRNIRNTLYDGLIEEFQDVETLKLFHSEELNSERYRRREIEELNQSLESENEKLRQANLELLAKNKERNEGLDNSKNEKLQLDYQHLLAKCKDQDDLVEATLSQLAYFKEYLLILRRQVSVDTKTASTSCQLLTEHVEVLKQVNDQSIQVGSNSPEIIKVDCDCQTDQAVKFSCEVQTDEEFSVETKTASTSCELITEHVEVLKQVNDQSIQVGSNSPAIIKLDCDCQTEQAVKFSSEVQTDEEFSVETKTASTSCELITEHVEILKQMNDQSVQVGSNCPEIIKLDCDCQTEQAIKFSCEVQTDEEFSVDTKTASTSCELITEHVEILKQMSDQSVQVWSNSPEIIKLDCDCQTDQAIKFSCEAQTDKEFSVDTKTASTSCQLLTEHVEVIKQVNDQSIQVGSNCPEIIKVDCDCQTDQAVKFSSEVQTDKEFSVDTKTASTSCELITEHVEVIKQVNDQSIQVGSNCPEIIKLDCDCQTDQAMQFSCEVQTDQQFSVDTKTASTSCQTEQKEKINRGTQIVGKDQTAQLREWVIKSKTLEARILSERQTNSKELQIRDTTVNELKNLLAGTTDEIGKLKDEKCNLKRDFEQHLMPKTKVTKEVQCNYMSELIQRSCEGEHGLLPAGFPNISQLLQDNKVLKHKVCMLQAKEIKGRSNASGPELRPRYRKEEILNVPPAPVPQQMPIEPTSAANQFADEIEQMLGLG